MHYQSYKDDGLTLEPHLVLSTIRRYENKHHMRV